MHSPWVVGANAAMLNVTTIVSLQSIQGLSPGFCFLSLPGNQPQGGLPLPLYFLVTCVYLSQGGWPLLSSSHSLGP